MDATPLLAPRATEAITQNEVPGGHRAQWATKPELSLDDLQDAYWLALSASAASPGSIALVADVSDRVAGLESATKTRKQSRRKAGLNKLRTAVGAIVGGVLRRWARQEPQAVFRSRTTDDFTGSPVGARQFLAAMDALLSLGLICRSKSIRYLFVDWGDGQTVFYGKAPRYWPSPTLLELATHHGVTPASIRADFTDLIPKTPPVVRKPVQVFALKQRGKTEKLALPMSKLGADERRIRQGIDEANAFAAQHDVRGCLAPRWYRVFVECPLLGGRWQAAGREGVYQVMPEVERLAKITINGEPVSEFDVKASHLSIMHGLLGLPLPDGDPYDILGVPRAVVKAWITATLGKGSPVRQWARKAIKRDPELGSHDAMSVGRLICARFPFLRNPAWNVAPAAQLDRLEHIARPERLLTHRLMAIEAAAITGAMDVLRSRGVLVLPIHDSLLVPRSGVGHAGGALDSAFSSFAKVCIKWTVEAAPEHAPR